MAITPVDLTFDLGDLLDNVTDAGRTKVWIETNIEDDSIVDPDGDNIRLGIAKAVVGSDGSGSFTGLVPTNAATNPTAFQYRVWIDYPLAYGNERARGGGKDGRGKWSSGWFSLTTSSDLADVVEEQYVPPAYLTTVTQQLDAKVAEAEGYAQQARDISNIDTTDDAVDAALKLPGGKAASTLSDSIVATADRRNERINPVRPQRLSQSKGQLGLGGRTPVALRFDDGHDAFLATVYPLLRARDLPASLVSITRPGAQSWFTTTTWTQIRDMNRRGIEIWSHGTDHGKDIVGPQTPYTYDQLVREIVTSKAELEAQNLRVMGFANPGTGVPQAYGSDLFNTADWDTVAGRLLTATYALHEYDMSGPFRHLPSDLRYGLGHFTISESNWALGDLTKMVDQAVRLGVGLEFMCHSSLLGTAGKLSVSVFTQLLDYLVAQRDAGVIEIITPSSLAHCDPTSTNRLDLLANGTFADTTTTGIGTDGVWQDIDGTNNLVATIPDNPRGRTGNVLRIAAANGTPVTQRPNYMQMRDLRGMALMLTCKARGVGGAATLKMRQESITPYATGAIEETDTLTTSWKTVRMVYTPDITTDVMQVGLSTTAGVAEVTDAHLYVA